MSTDLLKQIDDLVASKTFNLDALDGIKSLKDSLTKTLAELEANKRALLQQQNANIDLTKQMEAMTGKVEFLNGLVKANEEMAKKGQEAIYDAAKHKAVAEAWQGAMAMVFKPNAVREVVQRNVAVPVSGNPGGNGYSPTAGWVSNSTESETVVKEDA